MNWILNKKVVIFSIVFGGFYTSLFSQTNRKIEKVEKVEPLKITSIPILGKEIERTDISCEYKCLKTPVSHHVIKRPEIDHLASRSLYDMVMIIK